MLLVDSSKNSTYISNFNPIEQLKEFYNRFENMYITHKLTKRAEKALNEKFRYTISSPKDNLSTVCKLLIYSYPKHLIYDTNDDLILGTSKIQGGWRTRRQAS